MLQLSDDWEPVQAWDDDILRALREGRGGDGVGLDDEWVLQVSCARDVHVISCEARLDSRSRMVFARGRC
jgi:hypothetical protein